MTTEPQAKYINALASDAGVDPQQYLEYLATQGQSGLARRSEHLKTLGDAKNEGRHTIAELSTWEARSLIKRLKYISPDEVAAATRSRRRSPAGKA